MSERDKIIEECMRAVLSLRNDAEPEDRELMESITGAACFRLMRLQDKYKDVP